MFCRVLSPVEPEEVPKPLPPEPKPEDLYLVSVPRVVRPGQYLDVFISVYSKQRGFVKPTVELKGNGVDYNVTYAKRSRYLYSCKLASCFQFSFKTS